MNKKNLIYRAATLLAAVIMAGSSLTVQAAEEQSVTYVYHKHIGSSDQEGGCYHTPIFHVHTGNEQEYGGCYGTPVYHSHSGDEKTGGGCYGTAVLHVHEGNSGEEGGCYHASYHSHVSSCYREVPHNEYGCYIEREVDTSYDDYDDVDFRDYYMSCGRVIHGTNPSHSHNVLNCNRGNEVVGYVLGCGKTEESIDGYLLDCAKTQEDIDSYALSCNKTAESIDAYGHSCGKDEETPIGKIILTAEKDENRNKETVTARFEDLTSGEIQLSDNPFTWYNPSGKMLGTGDTMVFYDNGNYSVVLSVINEDVNRDSLRAGIKVSSIVKPAPEKGGGNSDDSNNDNEDNEGEDSGQHPVVTPTPSAVPTPTAAPQKIQRADGDNNNAKGEGAKRDQLTDSKEKSQEVPTTASVFRKETRTVTLEEKGSEREELSEIQVVEPKQGFLDSPKGKLITITVGGFLTLAGLFAVLYLLRQSVRVYNDDGKGDMTYLGRCRVRLEEDGYSIEITDAMAEKSVTNRYCIKPGLFALFKGEEEELLVVKGQKRISVALSREMIAVI